jgi:hypothetical protein
VENHCGGRTDLDLEILTYFLKNPSAVDSLEGITRWRLLQAAIERTTWETDEALRRLVSQGFLVEEPPLEAAEKAVGRKRMFRLNVDRLPEAEQWVQERAKGGSRS